MPIPGTSSWLPAPLLGLAIPRFQPTANTIVDLCIALVGRTKSHAAASKSGSLPHSEFCAPHSPTFPRGACLSYMSLHVCIAFSNYSTEQVIQRKERAGVNQATDPRTGSWLSDDWLMVPRGFIWLRG
jgi:hypothetical protein